MNKLLDTYYRLRYAYFFKGKEGLYNEIGHTLKEVFRVR